MGDPLTPRFISPPSVGALDYHRALGSAWLQGIDPRGVLLARALTLLRWNMTSSKCVYYRHPNDLCFSYLKTLASQVHLGGRGAAYTKNTVLSPAEESCGSMARLEARKYVRYSRDGGDLRGVVDGSEQSAEDDLDRGDPQGGKVGKVVLKRLQVLLKIGQGSTRYILHLF